MRTVTPGNDSACSLKTVPTIRNPGLSFVFGEQGPGACCTGLDVAPVFVFVFVEAAVAGVCCAVAFLAEQQIKTASSRK